MGHGDLENAKFVIDQTAGWIRHADAKVAILATAVAVVVGFLVADVAAAIAAVRAATTWSGLIAFFCVASVIAAVITTIFLVSAIVARTESTAAGNRFSWPDLASGGWPARRDDFDVEAKEQAEHLARLAKLKFRNFNKAFYAFLVLLALAAATILSVGAATS